MPSWPAGTGHGHQWGQRQTLTEMSFHEAGKAAQDKEHSRQMLKGFHGSSRAREDGNYHRCTGAVGEPRTQLKGQAQRKGSTWRGPSNSKRRQNTGWWAGASLLAAVPISLPEGWDGQGHREGEQGCRGTAGLLRCFLPTPLGTGGQQPAWSDVWAEEALGERGSLLEVLAGLSLWCPVPLYAAWAQLAEKEPRRSQAVVFRWVMVHGKRFQFRNPISGWGNCTVWGGKNNHQF